MRRYPRDPHEDPPRYRHHSPRGPVPTLLDMHRTAPWLWVHCERCQHGTPMAIVPLLIRWGMDVSTDVLRQRAVCSACGHKGATLQVPGWVDKQVGFMPFPIAQP